MYWAELGWISWRSGHPVRPKQATETEKSQKMRECERVHFCLYLKNSFS